VPRFTVRLNRQGTRYFWDHNFISGIKQVAKEENKVGENAYSVKRIELVPARHKYKFSRFLSSCAAWTSPSVAPQTPSIWSLTWVWLTWIWIYFGTAYCIWSVIESQSPISISLASFKHDVAKKDQENLKIDWDLRPKKQHSNCNRLPFVLVIQLIHNCDTTNPLCKAMSHMNANLLGYLLWRCNGGLIRNCDMTNLLWKPVIHMNVNHLGYGSKSKRKMMWIILRF